MIAGFEGKLHCEGIVGDGCGGGRIFYIDDDTLYAHDPITKENFKLFDGFSGAKSISKKACVITIECKDEVVKFDLSKMMRV